MTQEAIITATHADGTAEACVTRQSACGGNCSGCETCLLSSEIKVIVKNFLGAKPGQKVIIESSSSKVYSALLLVYAMPVLFMLLCYFAAYAMKLSEAMCVVMSLSGLIISAVVLWLVNKKKSPVKNLTYTVCRIVEEV